MVIGIHMTFVVKVKWFFRFVCAQILQVPASALAAQNGDENTEEDDEMVTSDIEINDEWIVRKKKIYPSELSI